MPRTRMLSPAEIAADLSNTLCATTATGSPLPSVRDLSAKYRTSRETVRRAIVMLQRNGVVTTRHGLGTVVGRPAPAAGSMPTTTNLANIDAISSTTPVSVATCEWGSEKAAHWSDLVKRFNALRPDIQIQLLPQRFTWPLQDGTLADIIHAPGWTLAELAEQNRLINLSPWLGKQTLLGDDSMDEARFGLMTDPCWCVPITFDVRAVFLNTDAFSAEELHRLRDNWNLEGIVNWACTKGSPPPLRLSLPRPHAVLHLCGMDCLDVGNLSRDFEALPAALEKLAALFARYPFYERERMRSDYPMWGYEGFLQGRMPIAFARTFLLPNAVQRAKSAWAVWPFPVAPGEPLYRVSLGCGVSKHCGCPEAALSFAQFLTGSEAQQSLGSAKNNVPVRRSAAERAFAAAPPPGLDTVVRQITRTKEAAVQGRGFSEAYCLAWDQELESLLFKEQNLQQTLGRLRSRTQQLVKAFGVNVEFHG